MKKILFYTINALICSMFLSVRLAFTLFVVDKGYLTDQASALLGMFTFLLLVILLINICLAYFEMKKWNV